MSTKTVAELVEARAEDANVAVSFEDQSWTWNAFVAEACRRAALLQALGQPGPFHIGVLLENVPEYAFLLAAAALSGATVVGVNPTRRGNELATDIRHTDCQLVVTQRSEAPLLSGIDVGVEPERIFSIESERWRDGVEEHRGASLPAALPAPDTLFVLIFTSGSTGAPKAVRGTQGRFATFGDAMPFTPADVLYSSAPLFHGNALSANYIPALRSGASMALRRKFSASEFMPDVRRFGATYFNTVGRALSYILATPPSPDDRNHHVKFALAPESSPADIAAFTKRFGIPVFGGYGSSEGAIVIRPVRDGKPGALGRPDRDVDIAIVDDAGNECSRARFDAHDALCNADVAIGEIVRRDPKVVFEGYYDNEAATAERSRNGWYWSGDLGYRDEDDIFYFAGRTADWIRVDGENFAAGPVERVLGRHDPIAAVAVYAVPDPVTGDQVMAAVELRAGARFDAAAFGTFVRAQPDLGTKWAPRFVRVLDQLPVTGADKIGKVPLRRGAWRCDDVWWSPERNGWYEPFTREECDEWESRFREHGRADVLAML